jgi:peptidoglycan/LPS O-acetylase OafA/YrhL
MLPNQNNSQNHIYKMDVLRGIAISFVFLLHCYIAYLKDHLEVRIPKGDFFVDLVGKDWTAIFLTITPFGYGWSGVQLFLIISGYLIHQSYLRSKTEQYDFKKFYLRRFFRIYPPYFVILTFLAFQYNRDIFKETTKFWDYVSHLFLTHNLNDTTFFSYNGSFWSLALEAQLYLIYPIFLFFRKKMGIQNTIYLLFGFYLFFTIIFETIPFHNFYFSLENFVFRGWIVWGLGALLAERHFENKQLFKTNGWGILGLLMLVSLVKTNVLTLKTNYLLWSLFYVNIKRTVPFIWEKMIAAIGESSYSLYLIHQPIIHALIGSITFMGIANTRPKFHILDGFIIFLISYALSKGLYYLLEKPSIDYGKKLIDKYFNK